MPGMLNGLTDQADFIFYVLVILTKENDIF
jgi:hypothetical protein